MEFIQFPQANTIVAEDQEYRTIPAWSGKVGPDEEHIGLIMQVEFTDEEIQQMKDNNNRMWMRILTFGDPLQPLSLETQKDMFEETKEEEDQN